MLYVDKQSVVRVLREISLLLQIKGENAFKSRAYDIGADRIAGLNDDLHELVAAKRLQELPNIGPALAEKIRADVAKAPGVVRASLGGSVRRLCETVGDVDLIASAAEVKPVFDALKSHGSVRTVIGDGDSKCSVRLFQHELQVDLRVL